MLSSSLTSINDGTNNSEQYARAAEAPFGYDPLWFTLPEPLGYYDHQHNLGGEGGL